MRLLKIIFIYSLLIIYSLEFLLFFTLPEEQKTMIKIKEERIKKAKELNNNNIEGIIVGKAIYDGDIKLDELAKELNA